MGKTLKQYSYKGVNIYIRFLGGLWYETLIVWRGGVYAHQLQLRKPKAKERRNNIEERHKGATTELQVVASILVDSLQKERSLINQIKQLYGKTNISKWLG